MTTEGRMITPEEETVLVAGLCDECRPRAETGMIVMICRPCADRWRAQHAEMRAAQRKSE